MPPEINRSTFAPVPGLDLRSLQMDKAAMVLRCWADSTLKSILEGEEPTPEDAQSLFDIKLKPSRASWRQALGLETWGLKPLPLRDQNLRLNHPISFFILRHLRASCSRCWAWIPLRWRPKAILEPYWPPSLWTGIASMAWLDPRFQKKIATAVQSHFRNSQLISGAEPPLPVIRQEAWWLLIDLVGIPDLERPPSRGLERLIHRFFGQRLAHSMWRGWRHFSLHQFRRRGKLQRRLSGIAQKQVLSSSGWAGFWEQWLVGETLLHRPEALARATAESRQMLDLLPLLEHRRYRAARDKSGLPVHETTLQRDSSIIDANWRDQQPSWFQADLPSFR